MITKLTGLLNRVLDEEVRLQVGQVEYQVLVPEFVRRQVQGRLGAEMTLVEPGHIPPFDTYSWLWPVKMIQASLLAAGGWAVWRFLRQPGGVRSMGAAGVMAFELLVIALFAQPMSVTC